MNDFEKGIIELIKSGLTGNIAKMPADFDWNTAYDFSNKHQIMPLIYYGVINSGLSVPADISGNMELVTYKHISYSHNQLYALDALFKAFDQNKTDYMPLKGSLLKYIYPKPEMRPMSDADILIKTEQYDKIRAIMQKCGFSKVTQSDHEFIWRKEGIINIELHKRLIPSYNKDYYAYYGDGWRLAKPKSGSRFEMTDEDNLIYIFTHYAKHYRDGGIGVRHITDLYVYLSVKPKLNMKYVYAELEKLELLRFFENTVYTIGVWFNGKSETDISNVITDTVFGSGSYGSYSSRIIAQAYKKSKSAKTGKNVRLKLAVDLIFPSYNNMCIKYPFLKKVPVLMPVMWAVRWITAIFAKKVNIKRQSGVLKISSAENIDDYSKTLKYVGLDFNFEE